MHKKVFQLLTNNTSGVLSRITGLFSRRGYNIDSLTVGETLDPKYSKMTVTATGDDDVLEQIEKQLAKLIDVKEIVELPAEESVCRELILIKVKCDVTQRSDVVALANIFHARILDVSFDSVVVELTGEFSKLGAFVELLNGFEIIDIARTGLTGLSRGFADIK